MISCGLAMCRRNYNYTDTLALCATQIHEKNMIFHLLEWKPVYTRYRHYPSSALCILWALVTLRIWDWKSTAVDGDGDDRCARRNIASSFCVMRDGNYIRSIIASIIMSMCTLTHRRCVLLVSPVSRSSRHFHFLRIFPCTSAIWCDRECNVWMCIVIYSMVLVHASTVLTRVSLAFRCISFTKCSIGSQRTTDASDSRIASRK